MARNHHSDDEGNDYTSHPTSSPPETHGSLGANGLTSADMELTGMGESMASSKPAPPTPSPAQEAARVATKMARSKTSTTPSPISMDKKRGNQPR